MKGVRNQIKFVQKSKLHLATTFSILLLSISSCNLESQDGMDQGIIDRNLERKLNKYRLSIKTKCIDKARQAAIEYTDSLVAEIHKINATDTLRFPNKPIRPALPEKIILNDSTDISPVIKQ